MPRGFAGVSKASAELESRRGSGSGALWFRLGAGEETVVRFLEEGDGIFWAMTHEIPVEGRNWGRDVVCLDQEKDGEPCPGCEHDLPRRFKGYINVIWQDAPKFKRDDSGKLVRDTTNAPVILGREPQVAVWSSGIRLFEELAEIDTNYKGLTSRRFRVKRRGSGLDTKYSIVPEDIDSGPQSLTDHEQKLAAEKFDLNEFVQPKSYEDFVKEMEGGGQNGGGQQRQQEGPRNPFMRRS